MSIGPLENSKIFVRIQKTRRMHRAVHMPRKNLARLHVFFPGRRETLYQQEVKEKAEPHIAGALETCPSHPETLGKDWDLLF